MERSNRSGEKLKFLCGLLVVLFLFSFTQAEDGDIKQVTDNPRKHPNLTPYEQWHSAYECLANKSSVCTKYILTEGGWINVTRDDTADYCQKGCANHTLAVLKCVQDVKRDYKFQSKASVQDLRDTITHGCASGFTKCATGPDDSCCVCSGFTGKTEISSAEKIHQKTPLILMFSALIAYCFIGKM